MRLAVRGILLSLALALALPAAAQAFPSFCSAYDPTTKSVGAFVEADNLAAGDHVATLSVSAGGAIQLNGANCSTATATNTDDIFVGFNDPLGKAVIDVSRPFAPGATAEVGISEVEITVAENSGNSFGNALTFAGGSGADRWEVGAGDEPAVVFDGDASHVSGINAPDGGIDLNPDEVRPDADVLWDNADDIFFDSGGGADSVDFRGGLGAGAAYAFGDGTVRGGAGNDTVVLQSLIQVAEGGADDDDLTGSVLDGGDGDDTLNGVQFGGLTGGPGADVINGTENSDTIDAGPGNDLVRAGGGTDTIELGENDDRVLPGAGNDTVRGDEGTDVVDASESAGPVTFDLALGDVQQDTGDGSDRLVDLEGATGSPAGDTLRGNAGTDFLAGGGGDDMLVDRGGGDGFDGGPGTDTLSYADSPVPVSVDLAAGTANAGGIDSLAGVERYVGSAFGDVFAGGPGRDEIASGDGNDRLLLRDGSADSADCGAGDDTAEVDGGGDAVVACETVAFPPPPACVPGTEIPGNGADENCDGGDAPFPLVTSTLRSRFDIFRRFVTFTRLRLVQVPAGATVDVRCRGRGCPYAKRVRTFARRAARRDLLARFDLDDARLRPRAVLEIRILLPGHVGKVVRFKIRKPPKAPTSRQLCLPPGATKPVTCG